MKKKENNIIEDIIKFIEKIIGEKTPINKNDGKQDITQLTANEEQFIEIYNYIFEILSDSKNRRILSDSPNRVKTKKGKKEWITKFLFVHGPIGDIGFIDKM